MPDTMAFTDFSLLREDFTKKNNDSSFELWAGSEIDTSIKILVIDINDKICFFMFSGIA